MNPWDKGWAGRDPFGGGIWRIERSGIFPSRFNVVVRAWVVLPVFVCLFVLSTLYLSRLFCPVRARSFNFGVAWLVWAWSGLAWVAIKFERGAQGKTRKVGKASLSTE